MMDHSSSGGIRSPFSPRVRQSISGRRPIGFSNISQSKLVQSQVSQGDVIYKTPLTTIESFGSPLPVMVTETLAFASGEVTVRLSSCGWCWLVAGRKVLAWSWEPIAQTGATSATAASPAAARELTLPQTDLAHKADLVVLFYEDGAQMPSCIGVSPEGTVRYWPSVGQEGVYVDVSAELAGQECDRLGEPSGAGLVLATTTCTVVILNPTVVDGRATVTCRTLRPPSGWLGLGGIGRRVSLLFFGSMPAHADTKLVGVVVVDEGGDEEAERCVALVAGGPVLQLWRGPELHEHNLRRALLDAHAHHRTPLPPQGDPGSLELAALDVRRGGPRELLLLLAAANATRSLEVRYSVARVCVADAARPRVLSVLGVRAPGAVPSEPPPRLVPLTPAAYALFAPRFVAVAAEGGDRCELVDVAAEGDRVLGAAAYGARALLFTRRHGVLALSSAVVAAPAPPASPAAVPPASPCPSDVYDGNLTLYEIDPHQMSAVNVDACGKLKTAFLFHVRRSTGAAARLLAELAPRAPVPGDVDAPLDRTVLRVAQELLDDVPAGDPRWRARGQSGPHTRIALGSSTSLQVAAQLRDKRRAFALYVEFLRAAELWPRLGLLSRDSAGGCVSTQAALGQLAEQLTAAQALRALHEGPDEPLLDAAVSQSGPAPESSPQNLLPFQIVVMGGGEQEEGEDEEVVAAVAAGALKAADASYRRVSRTSRVLCALASRQPPANNARAAAQHYADVARVLVHVLAEVHRCRSQWTVGAGPHDWAAFGGRALLPALTALHGRALAAQRDCADAALRAALLDSCGALADRLLTEAGHAARDAHSRDHYHATRRSIIQPYVDEGHTERALVLAEKFEELELLTDICMERQDYERLRAVIDQRADEAVEQRVWARMWAAGGEGRAALVRHAAPWRPERVGAWLARVPERAALCALQRLADARYADAATALTQLAARDTHSRARTRTAASLAKLCLLAADADAEDAEEAERLLMLVRAHEQLPRELRVRHGLDADDSPLLAPEQLIQIYVESNNKHLSEHDYKRALELLYLIPEQLQEPLLLDIWSSCVLNSCWKEPEDVYQNTFFRLIHLLHLLESELEGALPPLDLLLGCSRLQRLVQDPTFCYHLQCGYEMVQDKRKGSNNEDN